MEDKLAAAKVPVWWRKKLAAPNSRLEVKRCFRVLSAGDKCLK